MSSRVRKYADYTGEGGRTRIEVLKSTKNYNQWKNTLKNDITRPVGENRKKDENKRKKWYCRVSRRKIKEWIHHIREALIRDFETLIFASPSPYLLINCLANWWCSGERDYNLAIMTPFNSSLPLLLSVLSHVLPLSLPLTLPFLPSSPLSHPRSFTSLSLPASAELLLLRLLPLPSLSPPPPPPPLPHSLLFQHNPGEGGGGRGRRPHVMYSSISLYD